MVSGLVGRNILAVGAHPDDVELGCYGTLAKLAKKNTIKVLVLTNGEDGGTNRTQETKAAFKDIGEVQVLDFPSGYLVANGVTVEAVRAVATGCDMVFTQTGWDTHQDHRAVEGIVLAAVRRRPVTVLGYHIISSTPAFPVNVIVDIKNEYDRKVDALKCHKSQAGRTYISPDFLRVWHMEKMATAVGLECVELFHLYQSFWTQNAS